MKKYYLSILFFLLTPFFLYSQEDNKTNVTSANLGVDLVNRYVWRGLSFSPHPNIQPYLSINYNGFTLGGWASYASTGQYAEIDFYLSYTKKNFTLSINDYYTENELDLAEIDHFNWNNQKTNHALEISMDYTLSNSVPLSFKAATFIYGNDKDEKGDNYYSTYLELSYPFSIKKTDFKIFAGGTPFEGLYSTGASLTNIGLSTSKEVKLSESYSIPLSLSIISNPKVENIFMLISISI